MIKGTEKQPIITKEETPEGTVSEVVADKDTAPANNPDQITVNDALEETRGLGTFLFLVPPHIVYAFLGAETILMSIVGLVLKCQWDLSAFVTSLIQMEVMVIGTISCLAVSNYTDNYGRKQILVVTFGGTLLFGFLSGIFDNVWAFILLRAVVGVFIGPAEATAITWIPEIPPRKYRSYAVGMCSLTWAMGTIVCCFIAYLTMNTYGWRTTVMVLAASFLILTPILVFARESPRWDMIRGHVNNATNTMKWLYRLNGASFTQSLREAEDMSKRVSGELSLSWFFGTRERMLDFVVVNFFAFSTGVNYYGAAFGGPRFIQLHPAPGSNHGNGTTNTTSCFLDDSELFRIMISAVPEGGFTILGAVAANVIGRKPCSILVAIIQMGVIATLYIVISNSHVYTIIVMALRCMGSFANTLSILIPSEYFPTKVRSAAEHAAIIGAKTGGCLAIVASQYLFDVSDRLFTTFLAVFAVLTLIDACFMKETLNKANIDSATREISYSTDRPVPAAD